MSDVIAFAAIVWLLLSPIGPLLVTLPITLLTFLRAALRAL
jgi:hypothetical protein